MKNIRLTLEYDGTRYNGWSHPNKKGTSVSEKLAETLHRITGENAELFCAARTEPGVHASKQTVNFKTNCIFSPEDFLKNLNHYLPQDIAILKAIEAPERFHAALNIQSVVYTYSLQTGEVSDTFSRKYTLFLPESLNISAMENAAAMLTGTHDFQNFSSGKKKKGTEKTLINAQVLRSSNDEIQFIFEANAFLHQMPLILAGTLLDIGLKHRCSSCISAVFEGKEAASRPAPAHALVLSDTKY